MASLQLELRNADAQIKKLNEAASVATGEAESLRQQAKVLCYLIQSFHPVSIDLQLEFPGKSKPHLSVLSCYEKQG